MLEENDDDASDLWHDHLGVDFVLCNKGMEHTGMEGHSKSSFGVCISSFGSDCFNRIWWNIHTKSTEKINMANQGIIDDQKHS